MGIRGIGLEAERYARQYGCDSLTLVPTCFTRQGYSQPSQHQVMKLSRDSLAEARSWIRLAQTTLKRRLINQIQVDHIACLFHVVQQSNLIVAIASFQDDHLVRGLTGWGVEFAKVGDKALYVYDLDKDEWKQWNGYRFELSRAPLLRVRTGIIGIKNVNDVPESVLALKHVFKHSLC